MPVEDLEECLGEIQIGNFILATNVVNVSRLSLVEDAIKGIRNILHEQKVARVGPIAVDGEGHALQELIGKFGNQLFGELVWTVDIVPASDEYGELEGPKVALDEELGTSLGGSVWIRRLEDVILHHGISVKVFTFAVDFVSRNVNETFDCWTALGTLQQNVSSVNVGMSKGE